MVSTFWLLMLWTVLSIPVGLLLAKWFQVRKKGEIVPAPVPVFRDLANPETRKSLELFLAKHGISGEADIRDCRVIPPVPPSSVEPLSVVLELAASRIDRMKNPNACSLYLRDSETDRWQVLDELSLIDLRHAARVIRRVAEDRKRSRAIYKGFEPDEVRNFVRAGLAADFRRTGKLDMAALAAEGKLDSDPLFEGVKAVVELIFKVKGADV